MLDLSLATPAEGRDWLAFAVALYGAVVASGVAIYQFVRDRPGVKVVLMSVVAASDQRDDLVDLWTIRVVNHRKRPITIESAGLLVERKVHLHPMVVDFDGEKATSPFPVTLTDGMSVQFYVMRKEQERVRGAWARDALSRSFEARYPSRNPRVRWRDWRTRRRVNKMLRERRPARQAES